PILWMGEVVYGITQTPQVWLDHQVSEENGALVFNWDAIESLFPQGLLQDMFEAYLSILNRLSQDEAIWREPMRHRVPLSQSRQLAVANDVPTSGGQVLLHTLFHEQVAERPGQTAVIAGNGSLTYEQLFQLGNHLGRQLRQLGARRNTLVAVVMEKGWE